MDDIGGFDFRVRLPGVQFYGEMYGEDQAHGMPSDWGYRGGVYLPQLTRDGSWDLVAEMAHTNQDCTSMGPTRMAGPTAGTCWETGWAMMPGSTMPG